MLGSQLNSALDSLAVSLLLLRARSKSFEQQPSIVLLDQLLLGFLEDLDQSFARLDHDWNAIDEEVDDRDRDDHLPDIVKLLLVRYELPGEQAEKA